MAQCGKEILISREGTEQQQRFIDALNPDFFKLNDFNLKEWMQFAYRFAEHVNYFDTQNDKNPSGDWTEFFKKDSELISFLESVKKGLDVAPHLALFVCFIKLIEITQGHFNKLTKRHLDFYYQNILKIEKLAATPDKVHIIFELAKNCVDTKIAQNTELDGGKDATGKKLIYKTSEEFIANKINLAQVKSVYNDTTNYKIKAADVANSYDGLGTAFPDDDIKWWPFGYYGDENYPELADAKLGFALSSKIFELGEGERNIQITIQFSDTLDNLKIDSFLSNLVVYCSGEKGWLGPFKLQSTILFTTGTGSDSTYLTAIDSTKKFLKLAFQINKDEKAIVNYNSVVLGEYLNTEFPVCRFLFKTKNIGGYTEYQNLIEKKIKEITVDIDVKGIKNLSVENDIGVLNVKKPFYPFGTQPVKNSNFYIGYTELFKKDWKNIDIRLDWKNTPEKRSSSGLDAFVDLYYAYRNTYLFQSSPFGYLQGMFAIDSTFKKAKAEDISESTTPSDIHYQLVTSPTNLIVNDNDYFKANVEILDKENWDLAKQDLTLFTENETAFIASFSVTNNNYEVDKNGPIKLSLNQSFLHELFPRIYALAFGSNDEDALIPNEPYTPLIESITLNYTAQCKALLDSSEKQYLENDLHLFHEHPFGQSEEHLYLKSQLDFIGIEGLNTYLVPTYSSGGELYLGLENASNLQQVSLLIQMLEGTENPEAAPYVGMEKVEWSVLCANNWKNLDSNYMVLNETDNFLKSGIVKFSIPNDATKTNTCFAKDLMWVKAKNYKNFDAVCKAISIYTQAVVAQFSDNGNELSHLSNGLAAKTISKLVQRVASVKSLTQPFNSFDGLPVESDLAWYRRISERLRHKNRAITVWDYENIILQQFPSIQKVKCLNHSTDESFLSPGNVLIIVIPDIVNKNVFDIYQPRVSTATLNEVKEFINQLNSLHVNTKVINPDYEEVTVELKAKFKSGYDENYYLKVLNEDITKFLSPWAYEKTAHLEFGITLHRSILINYIEKLGYIDFVEDVKLKMADGTSSVNITPSSPKAILVSAKQHDLSNVIENCTEITESQKTCH